MMVFPVQLAAATVVCSLSLSLYCADKAHAQNIPCVNGRRLSYANGTLSCKCYLRYTGPMCAECMKRQSDCQCICNEDYYGIHCTNFVNDQASLPCGHLKSECNVSPIGCQHKGKYPGTELCRTLGNYGWDVSLCGEMNAAEICRRCEQESTFKMIYCPVACGYCQRQPGTPPSSTTTAQTEVSSRNNVLSISTDAITLQSKKQDIIYPGSSSTQKSNKSSMPFLIPVEPNDKCLKSNGLPEYGIALLCIAMFTIGGITVFVAMTIYIRRQDTAKFLSNKQIESPYYSDTTEPPYNNQEPDRRHQTYINDTSATNVYEGRRDNQDADGYLAVTPSYETISISNNPSKNSLAYGNESKPTRNTHYIDMSSPSIKTQKHGKAKNI